LEEPAGPVSTSRGGRPLIDLTELPLGNRFGHAGHRLSTPPVAMVVRIVRLLAGSPAAGINAPIGNHSFRATGITAYLANGGALENAQEMAAHESPRTTKLYDSTLLLRKTLFRPNRYCDALSFTLRCLLPLAPIGPP
jgi:hypothetical protein